MKEIVSFQASEIAPNKAKIQELTSVSINKALETFLDMAKPTGIMREIPVSDFADIFQGEGKNEEETPIAQVFPKADRMALFAATLGRKISQKIEELFKADEFVVGTILDSAASLGADNCARAIETLFFNGLTEKKQAGHSSKALRYSPGYCGWHISGQKKLFAFLHPEKISIDLMESYLMNPLKSVSGVIVCGHQDIHDFENSYAFCGDCKTQSCRERMSALTG
ncbi:vitamin B12 dependent-methionine synthase activation domain-containing protein [Elusimicrobiota bacterium]